MAQFHEPGVSVCRTCNEKLVYVLDRGWCHADSEIDKQHRPDPK
jgi:hypothetical protein